MGIRCECPKGHRLNVKDELAGKRAKCPQCGEKFRIPEPNAQPEPDAQPVDSAPAGSAAGAPPSAIPKPSPARAIPRTPAPAASPAAPPPAPAAEPQPPAQLAPPPPAEWYARPSGGEQLGPVDADTLRNLVTEGRVTADTYLWRTGWDDWRRADQAGDELPQLTPATPVISFEPQGGAVPSAASRYAERRKRAGKRRVVVTVMLGVMALGLAGVLAGVLMTNGALTTTTNNSPPADPSVAEADPVEPADALEPAAGGDRPRGAEASADEDPFADAAAPEGDAFKNDSPDPVNDTTNTEFAR